VEFICGSLQPFPAKVLIPTTLTVRLLDVETKTAFMEWGKVLKLMN
jgi:hypothetical protein